MRRNFLTGSRVQLSVRYWGYFAAKLLAAGTIASVLWAALQYFWPPQLDFIYVYPPRFAHDLQYTLVVGVWFLICCGLAYLCILDQRYRCRVCLRRLMMPVGRGSWSRMLQLGRPKIEYICPYGHGKLDVAEFQISGLDKPEWTPTGDMWEELAGKGKEN